MVRLALKPAPPPPTLLGETLIASLLEFSQMFQTEISFPLGADISIFPLWSPGKGNLRGSFHTCSRLCARTILSTSHLHWPCSGFMLPFSPGRPPSCPPFPWARARTTVPPRPDGLQGAPSDWPVVFKPIFIHKKSVLYFIQLWGKERSALFTSAVK